MPLPREIVLYSASLDPKQELPVPRPFARVAPMSLASPPLAFSLARALAHPVLVPYTELLRALAAGAEEDGVPTVERLDAVLREVSPALPIRFVRQAPKPRRRRNAPIRFEDLYDGAIVTRGEVPTRDRNVHDLFNALAWALFPCAKAAIHRRQAKEQATRVDGETSRLPGVRTRVQDRLAMLDEGGLLFVCAPSEFKELEAALEERSGRTLDAFLRAGRASPILFGHAICEHLALGGGPLRCFALALASDHGAETHAEDSMYFAAIDAVFAEAVEAVAEGLRGGGAAVPLSFPWFARGAERGPARAGAGTEIMSSVS